MRRAPAGVELEDHALALAEHAEDGAGEGVLRQVELGAVGIAHDHAFTGARVVRLDDTLQENNSLRPTLGCIAPYPRPATSGEFDLIERIRSRLAGPVDGETWIGDDAAVVRAPEGPLLLATDVIVEGVHFDLSWAGLDDVGWQALTVNVSDIAAMGGRPRHALVSLTMPPGSDVDRLYDGLAEAAQAWRCPIVGGDVSSGPVLVVSVALTGTIEGGGAPVLRSGARPGDRVFVTGPLGATAAARRVRRFARAPARVADGEAARLARATAMIDVSDGLAADVGHLAAESGVGIALDTVPVAPGATREDALGGGEDYELVFTMPADREPPLGIAIGVCTDDPEERTLNGGPLPALGWEHSL